MTRAPSFHVSSRLRRGINRVLEGDNPFTCYFLQLHPRNYTQISRTRRYTSIAA